VDPDPVPDPGFYFEHQKIDLKKFKAEKKIFFCSKVAIYLSLDLHEGSSSCRRSLQPLKR
jgi:hypothetical protein